MLICFKVGAGILHSLGLHALVAEDEAIAADYAFVALTTTITTITTAATVAAAAVLVSMKMNDGATAVSAHWKVAGKFGIMIEQERQKEILETEGERERESERGRELERATNKQQWGGGGENKATLRGGK